MSSLTGLQIEVNGRKKFCGKVGICPSNRHVPKLAGHMCLYKEEMAKDAISHKLEKIGIDSDIWEKAKSLGAEGIVWYLKDKNTLVTASKAIIDESFDLDMGERKQKRIDLKDCKVYDNGGSISFGFTSNLVTV